MSMLCLAQWALLLVLCLVGCCCTVSGGSEVLAVDIGADWAKGATRVIGGSTAPRASIVLNDQTNRKSPQCIAFRIVPNAGNDTLRSVERLFAEEARSLEPRFPQQSICGPSLLAGLIVSKEISAGQKNHEQTGNQRSEREGVISFSDTDRFTYVVVPQIRRKSAVVRITPGGSSEGTTTAPIEFTVEELIGMILGHMKRSAERSLDGAPVRHLVLVVPTSSSLAYRQAMVDAAAVVGLRTIRLVHGSAAAATQLAHLNTETLFRGHPSNTTERKYAMIYDMGSSKTEVAVFRFTPATARDDFGTVTLVASATNHTLGGRSFDRCLARYVERNLFPAAKPTPVTPVLDRKPVTATTRRAVVSLLRAVNAARERLSVNQNVPFVVPGVREDGGDFIANISRAQFEEACGELFNEAVRLRDHAITQTNGTVRSLSELVRLELIGGATRMPKLQERLSEGYGKPADRTLNSDEAVVSGAALMIHDTLSRIRVMESLTNDIYFTASPPIKESNETKPHRNLLFAKRNTTVPAARSLIFPNRTADFTLTLHDGNGRYSRSVLVSGVSGSMNAAREKEKEMSTERANKVTKTSVVLRQVEVVVEVVLSRSGLPYVAGSYVHARYAEQVIVLPSVKKTGDNETTAQKDENNNPSQNETDTTSTISPGREKRSGGSPSAANSNSAKMQNSRADEAKENETPTGDEILEVNERDAGTGGKNNNAKVRHFALRFPLNNTPAPSSTSQGGVNMNKEEALAARNRLRALQRLDDERLRRSGLLNDVESLLLHYKSLDAWSTQQSDDNSNDWRSVVKDVSRWFDEVGGDVDVTELQKQYQRLKDLKLGE
ncbi:heat shock protein [Trypanosoma brucei equiperdum]|uniref:Heat shock protein n=1 Tax=Trypanosoma brucei equiperdum TaxID=630700 RepID=A0A3L6L2L3_9TRYP|nr:heat shock protein [Trypanosoma brucei equiperdum]